MRALIAAFLIAGSQPAVAEPEPPAGAPTAVCVDRIRIGRYWSPAGGGMEGEASRKRREAELRRGLWVSLDDEPPLRVSTKAGGWLRTDKPAKRLLVRTAPGKKAVAAVRVGPGEPVCFWYRELYDVWVLDELSLARRHGRCGACEGEGANR